MTTRRPFIFETSVTPVHLTDVISATNTKSSVAVSSLAHGLAVGDVVTITSVTDATVGGLTSLAGTRASITSKTANSFTIVAASAATATSADDGGNMSYVVDTTVTSQWYSLDYKYDANVDRSFWLTESSVSNESWSIEVGASAPDNSGVVTHFYEVSTYANVSSADGVLTGNWPSIRFKYIGPGNGKFVLLG